MQADPPPTTHPRTGSRPPVSQGNLKADAEEEKITTDASRVPADGARGDVGVKTAETH